MDIASEVPADLLHLSLDLVEVRAPDLEQKQALLLAVASQLSKALDEAKEEQTLLVALCQHELCLDLQDVGLRGVKTGKKLLDGLVSLVGVAVHSVHLFVVLKLLYSREFLVLDYVGSVELLVVVPCGLEHLISDDLDLTLVLGKVLRHEGQDLAWVRVDLQEVLQLPFELSDLGQVEEALGTFCPLGLLEDAQGVDNVYALIVLFKDCWESLRTKLQLVERGVPDKVLKQVSCCGCVS